MSYFGPKDFFLDLQRGLIPNHSAILKFGLNTDVDTGTVPEDIWDGGGTWVPPTTARLHDIVSTVAADSGTVVSSGTATGGSTTTLVDTGATFVTDGVAVGDIIINDTTFEHAEVSAVTSETTLTVLFVHHNATLTTSGDAYRVVTPASTGAAIVHVYGLDENWLEVEEFIVMNGTTNVPTTNTYNRIYRMHVDGADSGASNVGVITATAQTDATVTAQINATNGQTLMAVYTVPINKTAYMTCWRGGIIRPAGNTTALAELHLNSVPGAPSQTTGIRVEDIMVLGSNGSSEVCHPYKPYKKFESCTDIIAEIHAVTDSDTQVASSYELIIVEE